jgi:hypothetical protein
MTPLPGWQNFYVIVGSSAGALIGLQFVVLTLISDMPRKQGSDQAGHAFATPTIVHFGTVLLLSAALSAPWHGIASPAAFCGMVGLIGVIYAVIVAWRMRRQPLYKPVFEDWLFHALLPLLAYATLAASAYATNSHAYEALFGVAAAALLLLFVGIHNAWDGVTYHVFHVKPKQEEPGHGAPGLRPDIGR